MQAPCSVPGGSSSPTDTTVDLSRGFLRVVVAGGWTAEQMAAVNNKIGGAISQLVGAGTPYGAIRTLLDFRDAEIMPQNVTALAQGIAREHGPASARVAIVYRTTLQRLQQKRLATGDNLAFFDNDAEAKCWLFPDEPAAANCSCGGV